MGCSASSPRLIVEDPEEANEDMLSVHQPLLSANALAIALMFSAAPGRVQLAYNVHSTVLGTGTFAVVRLATSLRTGEMVAIKTVKLGSFSRDSMRIAKRRTEDADDERRPSETGSSDFNRGLRVASADNFVPILERRSMDSPARNFSLEVPPRHSLDSRRRATEISLTTAHDGDEDTRTSTRIEEKKSAAELAMLCREIDLLCRLKNNCVVDMHEYYISPTGNYIHIVLELLSGGTLVDELQRRHAAEARFDEGEARVIARRLLKGMDFLHSNNCVHRDLKMENLLLKQPADLNTVTIADFGFAKRLLESHNGDAKAMHTLLGTPQYTAPEVLNQASTSKKTKDGDPLRGVYGSSLDMWSFGVILYRLLCGCMPFQGDNDWELFNKIKKGTIHMDGPIWAAVSDDAKSLVTRVLNTDPERRPSAASVLTQDRWVQTNTHTST